jgi:hypothetical protein
MWVISLLPASEERGQLSAWLLGAVVGLAQGGEAGTAGGARERLRQARLPLIRQGVKDRRLASALADAAWRRPGAFCSVPRGEMHRRRAPGLPHGNPTGTVR